MIAGKKLTGTTDEEADGQRADLTADRLPHIFDSFIRCGEDCARILEKPLSVTAGECVGSFDQTAKHLIPPPGRQSAH